MSGSDSFATVSQLNQATKFVVEQAAGDLRKHEDWAKRKFESIDRRLDSLERDVEGLKKMLEHLGMDAYCVPDGETAITEFKKAKNSGTPFCLIIMDLTISGGMGGVKASKIIREMDQSIPLVVASGYSDDAVMSDYESYGFSGKLIKPFSLDDLRKTISSVLKE